MLKRWIALLRGNVRVEIRSGFPERILNLCGAHGIRFHDLRWLSVTELAFTVDRTDYARLHNILQNTDSVVQIVRRSGVPFLLGRLLRRRALLIGAFCCIAVIAVNSFFVWDFTVSGNETVPDEQILRVLRKHGVHTGMFGLSIRQRDLCNRALLDLPELSWLTVNVRGCRAYIEVRERTPKPEIIDRRTPTNIIAAKAGLITSIRALDGETMVLPGTTVFPGQLLISGIVDTGGTENPTYRSRFLAGSGEVYARTWYELSVKIPLLYDYKMYTGERKHILSLCWGENRIKIYGKRDSQEGHSCDKIVRRNRLTLPGEIVLPISLIHETLLPCKTERVQRSRQEAESIGQEMLVSYLKSQIGNGEIRSKRFASAQQGEYLLITLSAECHEQIGKAVTLSA